MATFLSQKSTLHLESAYTKLGPESKPSRATPTKLGAMQNILWYPPTPAIFFNNVNRNDWGMWQLILSFSKCITSQNLVAHLRYKCRYITHFASWNQLNNSLLKSHVLSTLYHNFVQESMHTSSRGNHLWIITSCISTADNPNKPEVTGESWDW